jgi:hypothetical protein
MQGAAANRKNMKIIQDIIVEEGDTQNLQGLPGNVRYHQN